MKNVIEKEKCCGCGACLDFCPNGSITMTQDDDGFLYPSINQNKCIDCEECIKSCPVINLKGKEKTEQNDAFAVFSKSKKVLEKSSSGGVFYHLAAKIINSGGTVFAAAYDENFKVIHKSAKTLDELEPLLKSKYVQSDMTGCFCEIRESLKNGSVLFCGTPCQCAAVKTNIKSDNLFVVSIACHGVPSPKTWENYLEWAQKENGAKLLECDMRDKSKGGWISYNFTLKFGNGKTRSTFYGKNKYFDVYIKNKGLRNTCYSCEFKGDNDIADITLADCWGAGEMLKKYNSLGTSAVSIKSRKGGELFKKITDEVVTQNLDFHKLQVFNPMIVSSATMPNDNKYNFNFEEMEKPKIGLMTRVFTIKNRLKMLFKK